MIQNSLNLNVDKTNMMIIGNPKSIANLGNVKIHINGCPINRVNCMKILGLLIDDKLQFTTHSESVSKKCNSILWKLFPIQNVLSIQSKTLLINAYIMSIINYA